jgi:LysR family transcriptional activator of nhaA
MINYKHLAYFYHVARAGGVNRAAERLHVTPQTLSGQISLFEDRLGVALFRRTGRRLELTEAGHLAMTYAEDIFQAGAELEETLKEGGQKRFMTFRVGVSDVVSKFIAYRLLSPALHLTEPVRLVCLESGLERLLADLVTHRIDVLLTDRPLPPGSDVKVYTHPLGESNVAFMAAPALAESLRAGFPGKLDGAPMLLPGKDSALSVALPRWMDKQGLRTRIVGEFDDSALMCAFAEAGAGLFAVPAASVADVTAHYRLVCIGETAELRERYFMISAQRKITHPAVRAVSDNADRRLFERSHKTRKRKTSD